MIGRHFLGGFNGEYDVDKLREFSTDSDDSPEPNYSCQVCGEKTHINDYQKHTPAWCDDCCCIQRHKKLAE